MIIAPGRAGRPTTAGGAVCPFCPGHEEATPPEITAIRSPESRPDTPGWDVRVIPNLYPALKGSGSSRLEGPALFRKRAAVGAHELIIESPRHVISFADFDDDEMIRTLRVYRDRIRALRNRPDLRYALLFKNVGDKAGASLEHTHTQIIATPVVPGVVEQETRMARRYWRERRRCIFCDMIRNEADSGTRIVLASESFIAICPFASRFAWEVWLLPTDHRAGFEGLPDEHIGPLAAILRDLLHRVEARIPERQYNIILHTAPFRLKEEVLFHWHMEILPVGATMAGFEWGGGMHVNLVPPEEAGRLLREA